VNFELNSQKFFITSDNIEIYNLQLQRRHFSLRRVWRYQRGNHV